ERKADLQKAVDKGDISKIAKRERKLAEAEAELKEAQAGTGHIIKVITPLPVFLKIKTGRRG
ncbi:hypothetical protein ABN09_02975, partial [Morganella morganii]